MASWKKEQEIREYLEERAAALNQPISNLFIEEAVDAIALVIARREKVAELQKINPSLLSSVKSIEKTLHFMDYQTGDMGVLYEADEEGVPEHLRVAYSAALREVVAAALADDEVMVKVRLRKARAAGEEIRESAAALAEIREAAEEKAEAAARIAEAEARIAETDADAAEAVGGTVEEKANA